MSNQLNMAEHHAIIGLARLNWSYRRIAAELGVDRETVSRHVRTAVIEPAGAGPPDSAGGEASANATIPITGSDAEPKANAAIVITGSTVLVPTGRDSAGRQTVTMSRNCCHWWTRCRRWPARSVVPDRGSFARKATVPMIPSHTAGNCVAGEHFPCWPNAARPTEADWAFTAGSWNGRRVGCIRIAG
jgi:hypothetical protein